MKLYNAKQLQKWDAYTIEHEPITSIDLMERAALACFHWLIKNNHTKNRFLIFCGKGNNGGDGLALARLLIQNNCTASVYILESGNEGSNDFQLNLERLYNISSDIHFVQSPESFPHIGDNELVVDALFGTGLNKPLYGISTQLVEHINRANTTVISIDLPSGLFVDQSAKNNIAIKATYTLSFQNFKLAFLLPENELYCGDVQILDIGLHPGFKKLERSAFEMADEELINSIYQPRNKFSHKGDFGHAALLCGSKGMMGAALLAAQACLRAGAGKLTAYIPNAGYAILQTSIPEAMCVIAGEEFINAAAGIEKFNSIGIGPGIGIHASHKDLLNEIFKKATGPIVIDADALNCMANDRHLLELVPAGSILTPHLKEFERLFGKSENDFKRLELALKKSGELHCFIILKGRYSLVATPGGKAYFNNTGNPGMATAGSGDVLTGILTGLLAQGYSALDTSLLGVYLHGLAGDIAAGKFSEEAMVAGDITDCLGAAFHKINR